MNVGSQRKLRQNEIVFSVALHRNTTPDTQKDPHTNHTGLQIQGSKDAPITQLPDVTRIQGLHIFWNTVVSVRCHGVNS